MNPPPPPSDLLREAAAEVVVVLREAGFQALWAGGCVRDQLLGMAPLDYDVATAATPAQVQRLFPKTITVGAQFGVVVVRHRELAFEVATFRAEGGYVDGRHPDAVRWADARADAMRRDFTVNAMFFDPVERALHDFVGGQEDLTRRIIRAVGDPARRFAEDHLRVLRAIRFAARLDFGIDPATWAALSAPGPRLAGVSPERICKELERTLTEGDAARGMDLVGRAGLRPEVLPELEDGDLTRAVERLRTHRAQDATEAWALLLYDVPDRAPRVARRLRWSRELTASVEESLRVARAVAGWREASVAARKRLLRSPKARPGLATAQAAVAAGQLPAAALEAARADAERWDEATLAPPPLLKGRDLARAGYAPGPWFGRALAAVEEGQLEGTILDEDAAWELVHRMAPKAEAP